MVKIIKPGKRIILYWFIDKGFFFIVTALLLLATYLRYFTSYYTLALVSLQLVIVTTMFSLLLLLYDWLSTEYYLLENHVFIKDAGKTSIVKYSDIKDVGYYGSVLQHMMGTTNVNIKTRDNKDYYLLGIKNYEEMERHLLKKVSK